MKPLSPETVDFLSRQIEVGKAVPGQSLTNSPDLPYKWERPAEFTNLEKATHSLFNTIYTSVLGVVHSLISTTTFSPYS